MLIHVNPVFFPFIKISRRASNLQTVVASNPPGHVIEEFEMTPEMDVCSTAKNSTQGGSLALTALCFVFSPLWVLKVSAACTK